MSGFFLPYQIHDKLFRKKVGNADLADLEFGHKLIEIAQMLIRRSYSLLCAISLALAATTTCVCADPTTFFPSTLIHEDDSIVGEFYLQSEGCVFELTNYVPSRLVPRRISITTFDLSLYETNPFHVNPPFSTARLSSRHNIVWFAKGLVNADIENINVSLRPARISIMELRTLTESELSAKQLRLTNLLAQVESGEFGDFASRNFTVAYTIRDSGPEIVVLYISRSFQLPVERKLAFDLINEVNAFQFDHCFKR